MTHDQANENVLTLSDVAKLFRKCERTIQRWVKDRRFPQPFRPGGVNGHPLWNRSDIELFIDAGGIHGYRREKRRS